MSMQTPLLELLGMWRFSTRTYGTRRTRACVPGCTIWSKPIEPRMLVRRILGARFAAALLRLVHTYPRAPLRFIQQDQHKCRLILDHHLLPGHLNSSSLGYSAQHLSTPPHVETASGAPFGRSGEHQLTPHLAFAQHSGTY